MTEQQRLLEECRQVAEEAALAGGRVLLAHRYAPLEIEHKDLQEVVTNVDRLSDEAICAVLRRAFPKHTIVSEESGVQDGDHCLNISTGDGARCGLSSLPR
jgi:myo-inositol-1(or 4)-monophosphatase